MANSFVTFRGLEAMEARLTTLGERFGPAAGAALRAEAEIEMTEAKRRTPVRTGVLRNSGTVTGPDAEGTVVMSFGGAAEAYAIEIHENLEMFHPRGGQAKFLESVVLESAPYLAQRVAERLFSGAGSEFIASAEEIEQNAGAVADMQSGVDE